MFINRFFFSLILTGLIVCGANESLAFAPEINTPALPYAVSTIGSIDGKEQVFLGHLVDDPHMYEFGLGVNSDLSLTIIQPEQDEPIEFSLIVVRVNDNNRGVEEVGRLSGSDAWSSYRDNVLGMNLLRSLSFDSPLKPGVYRVEISTPDNTGQYMLVFGGQLEDSVGYFSTLQSVYRTRDFFNQPVLGILFSSYIYYPIGSLILIWLLYLSWRYRQRLKLATTSKHG